MKPLLIVGLLGAAVWAATVPKPRVSRAAIVAMEKSFDGKISKMSDPFDLLGGTQGVYLEGYGAVFTTQLNLIVSPTINPFRQTMSKEEIAGVRARKLQRLPILRQSMREMLLNSAASLDTVPANEQIVLAVSLFSYYWEDTAGLPSQIVMQAQRQKLLKHATDSIRVQEF